MVRDGIEFLLLQVSRHRLVEMVENQLKLDPETGTQEQLLELAKQFPTLHKLGQNTARNPNNANSVCHSEFNIGLCGDLGRGRKIIYFGIWCSASAGTAETAAAAPASMTFLSGVLVSSSCGGM